VPIYTHLSSFTHTFILIHRHLIAKAELSKSVIKTDEMENAFDYLWSPDGAKVAEMMKC
jgi:hypothetical protein